MTTCLYWFRTDLRLHDHAGLLRALAGSTRLLPVYCHDPDAAGPAPWGFARVGPHRQRFLADTLRDLRSQLTQRGSGLLEVHGRPGTVLPALAAAAGARRVVCEAIARPAAAAQVRAVRAAGLAVEEVWLSSLLDPGALPYPVAELPRHFTPFRQSVEQARLQPAASLAPVERLPPLPDMGSAVDVHVVPPQTPWPADARSSFPYHQGAYAGGESAALAHVERYFAGPLPLSYKSTRNQLSGIDTSTKFSPWLALGALSPRVVVEALRRFEARHGPGEGSYAIWFEMLWRDFFRFLVLRDRARGAADQGTPGDPGIAPLGPAQTDALARWCAGQTGIELVDAGMRELAATGFVSNRLRQVAASTLIHELGVPAEAGAAWFEAQLLDFDPYSNEGNWRYIAGTGADPRGGRRFNVEKQSRDHDPDGQFRVLWGVN